MKIKKISNFKIILAAILVSGSIFATSCEIVDDTAAGNSDLTENISTTADDITNDNSETTTFAEESEVINQTDTAPPETKETVPTVKTYKAGTYLVNKDIDSGLYKVTVDDNILGMAYIERASDISMSFDDIIANISLTGNGYVTIKDTDVAVQIQGAILEPVDLSTFPKNTKNEVSDGIYLVGYDIAPGTYKVEVTDSIFSMAYVERMSDASMDFDAIIANETFEGQGYVRIEESDFAVQIQGGKLILQE